MASPYKPSPLSFNSPRASPFRRPSSPSSSPSTTVGWQSNPSPSSPGKYGHSPVTSPSKLKQSFIASEDQEQADQAQSRPQNMRAQTEPPPSPSVRSVQATPAAAAATTFSMSTASSRNPRTFNAPAPSSSDNLSKIPPQLLHSMREAFSLLDHNSSGTISQSDVDETLASLGISDPSQFFPSGAPQNLSLPQYLSQLANILVEISPQQELFNAFSAFDDDDSGQIDVVELRDALLHTAPAAGDRGLMEEDVEAVLGHNSGFTGRRVFPKQAVGMAGVRGLGPTTGEKKTGNVFRYQEFVGSLTGGVSGQNQGQHHGVKAA